MGKKNKLYIANKWNQPLFALGVDRRHQNIFDGLTDSNLNRDSITQDNWNDIFGNQRIYLEDSSYRSNTNSGALAGTTGPQVSPSSLPSLSDNMLQRGFSTKVPKNNFNSGSAGSKADTLKALTGVGLEMTGLIGKSEKNPNGLWDIADPTHYLANGMESSVGNGLGSAGIGLFKSGAQSGNGYMMLAGAGLKVAGSLTNAAFGTKVDRKRLNAVNSGINYLNS